MAKDISDYPSFSQNYALINLPKHITSHKNKFETHRDSVTSQLEKVTSKPEKVTSQSRGFTLHGDKLTSRSSKVTSRLTSVTSDDEEFMSHSDVLAPLSDQRVTSRRASPSVARSSAVDVTSSEESAVLLLLFRLDWDRWIMMGLIGFLTGIIGFLLHQFIGIITQYKWFIARQLVEVKSLMDSHFQIISP